MAGSGGSPKQVTYDPSVNEAKLQMKRSELTDKVTKRAYEAGREANVYSDFALGELNKGLGLLSNYLESQTKTARKQQALSEDSLGAMQGLQDKARAGASFITTAAMELGNQSQAALLQYGG